MSLSCPSCVLESSVSGGSCTLADPIPAEWDSVPRVVPKVTFLGSFLWAGAGLLGITSVYLALPESDRMSVALAQGLSTGPPGAP